MKSVAMIVQHASRIIPLSFIYTGGVPSIVEGDNHASVADTGVGIITVTFREAFARAPIVLPVGVMSSTGAFIFANARAITGSGFILEIGTEGGANVDEGAHVLVIGFDSADEA